MTSVVALLIPLALTLEKSLAFRLFTRRAKNSIVNLSTISNSNQYEQ